MRKRRRELAFQNELEKTGAPSPSLPPGQDGANLIVSVDTTMKELRELDEELDEELNKNNE